MKYAVECYISYPKIITVYADSVDEAEVKAKELVNSWDKVVGVEVNDIIEAN